MNYPSPMPTTNPRELAQQEQAPSNQVKSALRLAAIIWILAGIVSLFMPLVADEMYYLEWSRHLDWGYFDHPPMVSYVIWVAGQYPRVAAWLLSSCSIVILTIASKALGTQHWYLTPLIFVSTPLGLSAGLFMTPDIPLLLSWTIVIYAVIQRHSHFAWLGLSIGLLSKPTALLMIPVIIVRFGWRRGFGILLGALFLCIPMLIWSADNQWLPYSFQGARPFLLNWRSPISVLEAAGAQSLLVGPLLCWSLWHVLTVRSTKDNRLLLWMCLPILGVGFAVSAGMHLEANWLMMLWVPVAVFAPTLTNKVPRLVRILHRGYGGLTVLLLVALPSILSLMPAWMGPDRDGPALEECLRQRFPDARLLAVRYQEMALLSHSSDPPYLLVTPRQRRSQYNLWKQRILTTPMPGDIVLNLEGQCPGKETAYHQCATSAFECLPLSM